LSLVNASEILAAPVIIGYLGQIGLGLLTDRYGGPVIFAIVCLLFSLPVAGLALADTISSLLKTAFFLGVVGASFAVGVPFVNTWIPKRQRRSVSMPEPQNLAS
jgi:NNP family nitrate/nitrite transporter-like MFS transporter